MHRLYTGEVNDLNPSASGEEGLLAAMLEPSFYPRRPSEVSHRETHISHLFFAGDLVYKIKKSVRFSFLDYSTLGKRRYFLHQEMRLNQRYAPSVYMGVLPISQEGGGWQLGSDANPVEYTLVMRRLPERRMLDFLLERNQVTLQMMRLLAETLAPFHAQAVTSERIDTGGDPQAIQRLWEENLADIRPFAGRLLDAEDLMALEDFGPAFITNHRDLFARRVQEGRIRELHGDLHCEHICFAPEGIQIFDCVEFSPQLRYCDMASEIGFLVMDMELRGGNDLAREFLRRYLELMDDSDLIALLPFYKCYRALVRGKVAALRSSGTSPQASSYFDYARRVAWDLFKPFLILVCGLTGSGKSTLARQLGRRLGMRVVTSDATRKTLVGTSDRSDTAPYEEGIYAPSMTERTYAKMAEEAEGLILKREGVILDGTFQRKNHRELISNLAVKYRVPLVFVHCESSEEVARERLRRRKEEGRDLSDGRWEIYLQQKVTFEPIQEVLRENCLSLGTEAPLDQLVHRVEKFLLSILKNRS